MTTRETIQAHWAHANARRWAEFAALLHPDMAYECPQTREYAEGAVGYLEVFRTWPGDWVAEILQLICDTDRAVSVIEFRVGQERMTGISIFELAGGLITRVTDHWPEPYEPPPRATPLLRRRAA